MTDVHEPERPSRAAVIAAFATLYIVWGSTYLAIRYAVATIPPFLMAGTRFLIAGGALYAWARFRGAARPTRENWRAAIIVGGLLLFVGNGGVVWAEQRVPSGIASLLVAVVPLWMVLLDWLRPRGVRPSARVVAGVLVGLAGLALLVGNGARGGVVPLSGAGVLVLASLAWAAGSLHSRHAALPAAPLLATAMEMLGGGALLALAALLTGEMTSLRPEAITVASLLGLGYLIALGSLVGFTAYVWLLRVSTPAKVSTYAYVNPVVAVFLGWLIAGEPVGPRTIAAATVIIAAVVLITIARRPRAGVPPGAPPVAVSDSPAESPRDLRGSRLAPASELPAAELPAPNLPPSNLPAAEGTAYDAEIAEVSESDLPASALPAVFGRFTLRRMWGPGTRASRPRRTRQP